MSKSKDSNLEGKIDKLREDLEFHRRDTGIRFDTLEKRFDEMEAKSEKRYNKLMDNLSWLIGAFKKFDEEQAIIADKIIEHDKRFEKLEKVFGTSA